ncbi:MAG: ABC transporter permease subunit [Christensenellaceae bacterium]
MAGNPRQYADLLRLAGADSARNHRGGKARRVGFWQEIRHITLPLLGPLIGTQAVLNIIGMLGASGNILLLTEGRSGTTTLSYWFYDQIVVGGNYNVPAAMGLLMTLFTLPFVCVGRWVTNKIEDIEY